MTAQESSQFATIGDENSGDRDIKESRATNCTHISTITTTVLDSNVLKILSINVNSLISKLKLNVLQDYVSEYDVIFLQETKLDGADVINVSIPGFTPFYNHRKDYKNKSGGLATFIKDEICQHFTFNKKK